MRNFHQRLRPMNKADRRDWYRITSKKDDVARIDVYDVIGYDPWWDEGIAVEDFAKEVRAIKASRIELHINSPGGAAFDGVTMYNAVRDHPAFVEVTVDGLAASAASVLAMSGDEIIMNRASELMIHDASGLCWGNADDMADTGAILDRLSSDIAAIYADRAGGTVVSWRDAMREETWYSAKEAVEAGLAQRVVELKEDDGTEAKNRFDLRIFAHAGRSNAPAPKLCATNRESPRDSVPADGAVAKPEDGMTPDQLKVIGLPEDATEEQISDRLAELAAAAEQTPGDEDGEKPDVTEGGEDDPGKPEGGTTETTPEAPAVEKTDTTETVVPENAVLVDKGVWSETQNKLADLTTTVDGFVKDRAKNERDEFLNAAQRQGKFKAAQRQDYEDLYNANPDAARKLVNKLEANTVPVTELGHGGSAEDGGEDAMAYPTNFLTPAEKARIKQAQEA
jgi:ATP-dependent protease ClpP protease subunit